MEIKSNQDKLANEVKQYPEKLKLFQQHQQEYEGIYNDALVVTESEDVGDKRTAEHHKNLLQEQFDNLVKLGSDLLSLVPHVNSADVVTDDHESFDCSKEKLRFRQVLVKLDKVMKQVEVQDRK